MGDLKHNLYNLPLTSFLALLYFSVYLMEVFSIA